MFPGGMLLKSNNYWDYEVVKMKKKIILRGLFGLPVGIAIGFVITLLISICIGDGSFYPVTPELIQTTGNELNAVVLQTILCAILGVGFAMASVIWEIDSWSLAKQSGVYFLVISVVMLPIAYFANWMKHSIIGVLFLYGNLRDDFCGGLDFTVSALEEAHKENERTNSRREWSKAKLSLSMQRNNKPTAISAFWK